MINKKNKIHIVFGTTASGKSDYAIELAGNINAEIINADSMQTYRDIPIITNQPNESEKNTVPHHLFGYRDLLDHANMMNWLDKALEIINSTLQDEKDVIIAGGTGLYLKSLVEGISPIPDIKPEIEEQVNKLFLTQTLAEIYEILKREDPLAAEKIKNNDFQRIMRALKVKRSTGISISEWNLKPNQPHFLPHEFIIHYINLPRETVYNKINQRFLAMIEEGLIEEAKAASLIFNNSGLTEFELEQIPAYKAHGLREIIAASKNEISLEKAIEQAQQYTRNYAKRQLTWWRGWSKVLNTIGVEIREVN